MFSVIATKRVRIIRAIFSIYHPMKKTNKSNKEKSNKLKSTLTRNSKRQLKIVTPKKEQTIISNLLKKV